MINNKINNDLLDEVVINRVFKKVNCVIDSSKIKKNRNGDVCAVVFMHDKDNKYIKYLGILDKNNKLVAYCEYINKDYIDLSMLKTYQCARKIGYATILVNEIKCLALKENKDIRLYCLIRTDKEGNNLNLKFYKSLGFEVLDKDKYLRKDKIMIDMIMPKEKIPNLIKKENITTTTFDYFNKK